MVLIHKFMARLLGLILGMPPGWTWTFTPRPLRHERTFLPVTAVLQQGWACFQLLTWVRFLLCVLQATCSM